ncbi:outer membrane beta-barrel protein [Pseudaminobacter soli (ex Li et al. 2025)]|uniref:outer membrane beta-barrel protein n=1 Tax=Pseudaminobacter soli (ex Li et al. 2025) TaxID=1295366 RepID=UPI002473B707|nr:outer membrane beta-barrel protein [Mesorhizobium soli]
MLCMSTAAMLCALPAEAQDTGLRGSLSAAGASDAAPAESAAQPPARDQSGDAKQDLQPQYDPTSTGAIAPLEQTVPNVTDQNLYSLPANVDDALSDGSPPTTTTRRPSATRLLTQARASAETQPQQPVRENLRVETVDEDINTSAVRAPTIDTTENDDSEQRAQRVQAIESRRRPRDDRPFDPLGIRVGSFVLRSSLDQGLTATSNADVSYGGSSAVLSETTLRLNAASDWSRHAAVVNAYGNLRRTLSGEQVKDSQIGVDGRLDLDLGDEMRAFGALGYLRRPESASSPAAVVGTLSQPIRQTLTGGAGLEKAVGRARFGITGRLEHDMYGDAELSDGGSISQKDRDSTLAALVLRGGYEIAPALTPFVEAEIGRRFYDQKIDASGYERSSTLLGARAGLAFDMGEKLSGEFSAGWLRETFDDDRLTPISGPAIAAALAWSPERGTTVNLTATTTAEGATAGGESGSILHAAQLSAVREIRADLTANAALGFGYRDYSGSNGYDRIFSAELGAVWWMNRYAGLTGRLRHEQLRSNLPYRDYDANSVFMGVTVQR